jgi:hypothetical protein
MKNKASFRTFDPLLHDAPQTCAICGQNRPVFQFEFHRDEVGQDCQETSGFCCTRCAIESLLRLETEERADWKKEEAALQV